MTRTRIGFRESLRAAWGTSPALPIFRAVFWWARGVPDGKMRRTEMPTRWQTMSHRERVAVVVVYLVVVAAFFAAAAVKLATSG
jgi:hypothetical protein